MQTNRSKVMIVRSSLLVGIVAAASSLLNADANAMSGVAGWSGKAFFQADRHCFRANGSRAGNYCVNSHLYFVLYPVTSTEFTSANSTITVAVRTTSAVDALDVFKCRLDVYSNASLLYSSGWKSVPLSGGDYTVDFSSVPMSWNYVPEIVCRHGYLEEVKFVWVH